MRKISFVAIMAIILTASMSCNKSYKADIKTDIDTISYAIGQANGSQLSMYLAQSGIDSTHMADFIKGFNDGAKAAGDQKKAAYYMGLAQGLQMTNGLNTNLFGKDSDKKLSTKNLVAGLVAGVKNDTSVFVPEKIMPQINEMADRIHKESIEKQYKGNKEEGQKFLAEKAKDANVKKLANGVMYKVLKEGNGAIPNDSTAAKVKINYEGKLIDGTVFDSSYERKEPAEMLINQVVPGFGEALRHMPVGSTWEVYIPAEQAYGEREAGKIKPFSTLIFKIELLDIVK